MKMLIKKCLLMNCGAAIALSAMPAAYAQADTIVVTVEEERRKPSANAIIDNSVAGGRVGKTEHFRFVGSQ